MLSLIVFLPALAAAVLLLVPASAPRRVFAVSFIAVAALDLALVLAAWIGFVPGGGGDVGAFAQRLLRARAPARRDTGHGVSPAPVHRFRCPGSGAQVRLIGEGGSALRAT